MSIRRLLASLIVLVACDRAPDPAAPTIPAVVTPDGGTPAPDGGAPKPPEDAAADAIVEAAADAKVDPGTPTRVRIMAANITSGTQQQYETPGIHIFQGLLPDVVVIQEFKYPGADLRGLVDTAFGKDFSFYVEPRAGGIPNGIVSRYPILQSGVWADSSVPDRAFAYARIDVPGPIDLWAVSVHLLTSSASARSTEATQLAGHLKNDIPPGDYVVIGGDFNSDGPSEQALVILGAEVVVKAPFPADQNGNGDTTAGRTKQYDWVLARANLDERKVPVQIGAAHFDAGLVFDSRVYTPLADVAPVLVTDSAASGMQHMPVVRDFMLGGP